MSDRIAAAAWHALLPALLLVLLPALLCPGPALAGAPLSPRDADMVPIPPGEVQIGDDAGPPAERPALRYRSAGFLMDRTPVTVAQFAAFVRDSGYRTQAQRAGSAGVLDERQGAWIAVRGASWSAPLGAHGPPARSDHPVTQVSWFDAQTFCRAYGARLPTEFEWERAARLGQTADGHVFRAGDPIALSGHYRLNAWEGVFPLLDTGADGYRGTSPVGAFGAAPSGLTDMAGNVWEWTDSWYLPYGAAGRAGAATGGAGAATGGAGAATGRAGAATGGAERVSRGGSFLCSPDFCEGYRVSARNHATPDTALENVGFRCVVDTGRFTPQAGHVVQPAAARRLAAMPARPR
ncbi:MAG TPA: SUMF1/EgtB/PvdO family nonheme iron enzyme [Steroidobacteraceae bacterium]|nr:SUMF1/EgtB/PvdO family nonheme iron enzyme [Steroidobacteraceae bacterium]